MGRYELLASTSEQTKHHKRRKSRLGRAAWLALALLLLTPAVWAQVAFLSTWVGGTFTIVISHPREEIDGARFDCAPSQPNCRPFNLAACTDPPLPVSFTVSAPASGQATYSGTNQQVYAFLSQQSTCTYSTVAGQTGNNPNYLLGTASSLAGSSIFFTNGTTPFSFPQSLTSIQPVIADAASTGVITTRQLLDAMGVCPPNTGTNLTTWFLCVGLDADVSAGINNGTTNTSSTATNSPTGSDPVAYLQFQVDTLPPDAPVVVEAKPLNGRAQITGTFNTSEPDIYSLRALYTADPNNLGADGQMITCDAWTGDISERDFTVFGQAQNTVSFTLDKLKNNVPYGVCLRAVDYMRNASSPSTTMLVTPRFECDLFSCYPDTLHVGYCGGAATPSLFAMAVSFGVVRLTRRRKKSGAWLGIFALLTFLAPTNVFAADDTVIEDLAAAEHHLPPGREDAQATQQALEDDNLTRPDFGGDGHTFTKNPLAEGRRPRRQKKWVTSKDFITFDDHNLNFAAERERFPRWAVTLALGPYRPNFTSSAAGRAAYNKMYNGRHLFARRPLLVTLQAEYYLLQALGLGGPYVRVGFWHNSAPSRLCLAADGVTSVTCTSETLQTSVTGNDSQSLLALPLSFGMVYHFDYLVRKTAVPVILTARAGLDNFLWWASSGGRPALYNHHHAWGGTWGYSLAGGFAINFNKLSRGNLAQRASNIEYNLTAEYALIRGQGLFGPQRHQRFDFTDNTLVTVGLLAQFR